MKNFNKKDTDYSLYLCTDRNLMSTKTLEEAVKQALEGGCTLVQLREKECSSREFYETAVRVKQITSQYHVPLIINDRVDIAMAVEAEGIHVGQSDLSCEIVRKLIGDDKIIGVSAGTLEKAIKAQKEGADYLGVGAMYTTDTKKDAKHTSKEELIKIRKAVDIPIVVIGGINENTVSDFKGIGIDGLAVVSAIIGKKDIKGAAGSLKNSFLKL